MYTRQEGIRDFVNAIHRYCEFTPSGVLKKRSKCTEYRNQLCKCGQDIKIKHTFITLLKPCSAYLHGKTFLTPLFLIKS